MSGRVAFKPAWVAVATTYLLIAVTAGLAIASARAFSNPQLSGSLAQAIIPPLAIAVAGLIIVGRVPRLGWTLLAASLLSALSGLFLAYQVYGLLTAPGSLPGIDWVAWLTPGPFIYPGVVVLIMLLFPDGRLPSSRWRILVLIDIAFACLNFATGALDPMAIQTPGLPPVHNPTGLAMFKGLEAGPLGWVTFLGAIPILLAAIASLVVRLVRARGEVRQQIRWVVYALAISTSITILLSLSTLFIAPSPEGRAIGNVISNLVVTLGFGAALPAAMAIAVLKYRLYDIDVVINRTLVYAALALFISAVYVGIVVGIGSAIGSPNSPNLLLSIVATAVVAVAFQPVKQRIERLANRLVYGYRATPYELLTQFSHRVAGSYADEEVLVRLARVLVEGTAAATATVWLRGREKPAATWPTGAAALTASEADRVIAVRHQGEELGTLMIKKRSGEPLTPVERELIDDLAAQAGQVLRNVRLTSELQEKVEEVSRQSAELRASRQRIVAAQDAERRRLERNIHDGAQQHLVALAVKLRLAATLVKRDPAKAARSLEELRGQTADALATLRDLAQGIYPPVLRERGLLRALERHSRVEGDNVSRYEPDLEAAVYFSCLEALQNAAKHARATTTAITLQDTGAELRFAVRDNGVGFDPNRSPWGSGLQNMQDRISVFGGTIRIESQLNGGTTVVGSVPLRVAQLVGATA